MIQTKRGRGRGRGVESLVDLKVKRRCVHQLQTTHHMSDTAYKYAKLYAPCFGVLCDVVKMETLLIISLVIFE